MVILGVLPLDGERELAWALGMVLVLQPRSSEKDHQACGLCVSSQRVRIPLFWNSPWKPTAPRQDLSQEQSGISHFLFERPW